MNDDMREFGFVPKSQPERRTRHKWADVIIAWAEGRRVEARVDMGWFPCTHEEGYMPEFNNPAWEFRIAPEPKYRWVMRDKKAGDYWITDSHYRRDEISPRASADPVMPIEETRRDE